MRAVASRVASRVHHFSACRRTLVRSVASRVASRVHHFSACRRTLVRAGEL